MLETVLEAMTDGISVADQNLKMVAFNSQFLDLLGFPPDRFQFGDPFEKFIEFNAERGDYGPGDKEEQVSKRIEQAKRFESHRFERIRPDGTVLDISGNPLSGGVFVTLYSDITKRRRAEDELKKAYDTLEDRVAERTEELTRQIAEREQVERELVRAKTVAEIANRAKSDFLAYMSHELRTPLNAIIGFSEITQSQSFGPVGNQKYVEYAADINQSGLHLLAIINDVLDLSAIEAEKLELSTEQVGLATLAKIAKQFLSRRAIDEGVRIINTVGMETPLIMADKRRVKQILINLLSNAVKFTPRDGTVTISAGLEADGCMALVIADTGVGMDESEIAEALEPFGQADSTLSRKFEGTGLGLPLSKRLVEAHGGTLKIESRPQKGTTVTVRFPAERVVGL